MTATATAHAPDPSARRVRVVTAASLFDGHDAAINIMRRILQSQGAEVVHLGHDRSVDEIAEAAVQEDADAVAVSSYQGGHTEFFRYLVAKLREAGADHIRVYGGGGGTITPTEARELEAEGVARIFGPEEGRELGLEGMIGLIIEECARAPRPGLGDAPERLAPAAPGAVTRLISWFEERSEHGGAEVEAMRQRIAGRRKRAPAPVVGFTGTGGAGKSSVVDELVRRCRLDRPDLAVGLVLVDPTRRRSGGALLGDRIRMNAVTGAGVFARSLATRQAHLALSRAVADAVRVLQAANFDLVFVETAGIGQSDSEIVDLVDSSIYVMTPDYGAPSQLEKIDMLELADLVVLNKSDRYGARDALRDVRKQWKRNHADFARSDDAVPVYPTVASRWNDPGVDRLYAALRERVFPDAAAGDVAPVEVHAPTPLIPAARARYLAEIAEAVRGWHGETREQAERARDAWALRRALASLGDRVPEGPEPLAAGDPAPEREALRTRYAAALDGLEPGLRCDLAAWPATREAYAAPTQEYQVRDQAIRVENHVETLSGTKLPKVALPTSEEWGELARYLRSENLPGCFPFTAGVFPFDREAEDPTRMFAGEGTPERTNRRFHLIASGQPAARLSTAFDSVTLYGRDPHERPDIYGKVGNSGVSVCTVDDAKKLYSGFDLCDPTTSVSMTINGPAPTVLAFFLNAAIDQGVEKHLRETGRLEEVRRTLAGRDMPRYAGELPDGHDGLGLALLGASGEEFVDPETYARIRTDVLRRVRGTVQADILKEDQAQNTCIFSTEFSLRTMGDIQQWFVENQVRNFYSVSISGYHIAEAGANPITQLAFTLANGFTYAEVYRARGMAVDDFAPNFSFFFSNGLDAEYSVIGRVARRIWAIAMRERYEASERSQKLKYHIQTSGRSLHAQEMAFNDIRTTLQALTATQDRCNSLHTNAYDEAVTTPTEESVRRALAIQLVINRELGIARNQNPLQGAYVTEALTDLVEEAVLQEFERLSERGGVVGAMETLYQRGRIQDESLHYEALKHSGELPVIGVNTFENPSPEPPPPPRDLMRSTDEEKQQQVQNLAAFRTRHAEAAGPALRRLQDVARSGGNVFAELMETVKVASLGDISEALFAVGGRYRRSM
ncbi:MAG: methylmalonyl-CoA mutase family protein [Myxococcota bacterium]|nr:methylmalonyl-CoA mutase family protein [Myxococcota bacterium]